MRRLGELDDRFGAQGFFIAQAEPRVVGLRFTAIREIGFFPVTDVEQVAENLDGLALHSFAEQGSDGDVHELAKQVEQRRFNRRHCVDRRAQIEGLQAATAGIPVGKGRAHGVEDVVVVTERPADHHRPGILDGLANLLAARDFTKTRVAGAVLDDHDVACEEGSMRTGQVKFHTVLPGDGNHLQLGDNRRAADFFLNCRQDGLRLRSLLFLNRVVFQRIRVTPDRCSVVWGRISSRG